MSLDGLGLVKVLLHADDLALVAKGGTGLQRLLDALHALCGAHHLRVNVSDTEAVVFGVRR